MTSIKTIGTLVFCVATSVLAFGQEGLLNQKVTIRFENSAVADALDQLMKQTNTTINYRPSELPKERMVSKDFQQVKMGEVINELWGDDVIALRVSGNAILVKRVFGKPGKGRLEGTIRDENNDPLPGVTVRLLGTSIGDITDQDGKVNLAGVPSGNRTIEVSFVGYETAQIQVKVKSGGTASFSNQLKASTDVLNEVVVVGTSIAEEISLEPIKINTIDAKAFKIQSVDGAEMLKTAPGVLVRRSGGLGSNASVNINGLSGNSVRIYIDGFPVEYLGGGYSLNNLPGAVIDRLEVYKGVVPIDKGTDALGGAINIVIRRLYNDELEISYQVGSFNTHRASILGSKKVSDRFAVTLEAYHNYSDNDFLMGNIRNIFVDSIPDRFGNGLIPSLRVDTLDRVRRFHNAHRSSFVQAGLHWNNLSWADQLSFSSNFSNRFDEAQTLNISLGYALLGRTGETTAINHSLDYVKNFLNEKLELKYRGVLSNSLQSSQNFNLDRVNWRKEIIPSDAPINPLDIETEGLNHAHRLGVIYHISNHHQLSINNFYARSRFFRKNNANPFFEIDGQLINEIPSFFTMNIAAIEWRGDWLNKKLTSLVFGKRYFYNAETLAAFNSINKAEVEDLTTGYGGALKYLFTDLFFIRGSYEYAVRIPTQREVYGNFVDIESNFNLRPEKSNNVNLGITYEKNFDKLFRINTSLDGFLRDTEDRIWLLPSGASQQFRNNRKVRSLGVEWGFKVTRDDHSNIELNLTSQKHTYQAFNQENLIFQDPSFIGSRFPNNPSFFYNLQLNLGIKSLKSTLPNIVLYGSWFHVNEFSVSDEPPNGEPEPFSLVPTQNEFNLGIGYFSPNDKFSLSFQVNNLTNDFGLFDNWRVPKPNRNFQFKINYQIF